MCYCKMPFQDGLEAKRGSGINIQHMMRILVRKALRNDNLPDRRRPAGDARPGDSPCALPVPSRIGAVDFDLRASHPV